MRKIHLLPNVLTALGLACGLFVIFKLNMTGVGAVSEEVLRATAGLLLLAALFDTLDGAIARAMKATSEFGGVFDSMADAITFGVAPSVVVLKSLSLQPGSFASFIITLAALIYTMCGILRLVRFSVMAAEERGEKVDRSVYFTGLPIPAAAAAVVSLNLVLVSGALHQFWVPSEWAHIGILALGMGIVGYLMIGRRRFPSVKQLHLRVGSFQILFWVVLFAVILFYGFLYHFALVFVVLSWFYIALSFNRLKER